MALSIRNLTRRTPAPRAPFIQAATAVLPGWDISLVFVGEARAKQLNEALRGKSYVPNVLSYETTPATTGRARRGAAVPAEALTKSGEIIICLAAAEKQAPAYNMSAATYTLYLFIHGLLHLNGERHGGTMERRERALVARLSSVSRATARTLSPPPLPHEATHRHRHRHRHLPGKTGRGRGAH